MDASAATERDPGWVAVAVARDGEVAERWREALEAAGIEAQAVIGDAAQWAGRSSVMPHIVQPGADQLFAFPLLVPRDRREAAARVLIDAGWDGRYGERASSRVLTWSGSLAGAAVMVLIALAVIAALLVRS